MKTELEDFDNYEDRDVYSVLKQACISFYDYYLTPKIKMSPEYIFFNGLKEIFPPEIYEILIKILYLYIEGIISQYEFTVLITPYFNQETHHNLLLQHL